MTRYHRREGFELPNEIIHAVVHVIIENQAALEDETPVAATLERLQREGLDRHDAIHAAGSILAHHFWKAGNDPTAMECDLGPAYFEEVEQLTAQSWLDSFEE